MSIFLLGANGTLGFQIANFSIKKLNYKLTCLVRNRSPEMEYLTYWGVRIFYGDITNGELLAESMFGTNVVIDAATARVNDDIEKSDILGKVLLLRIAKKISIERFIFFSLVNAEKFKEIPLVKAKLFIENELKSSSLKYTIFRLTGFHQGVAKEYVLPMIDKKKIYLFDQSVPISYIDCMDVARLVLRSLTSKNFINKTVDLGGSNSWHTSDIIDMCKKFSGLKPSIENVSTTKILLARNVLNFFESGWSISRRFGLIDILIVGSDYLVTDFEKFLTIFQIDKKELRDLPTYLNFYINSVIDMILSKFDFDSLEDEGDFLSKEDKEFEQIEISNLEKQFPEN